MGNQYMLKIKTNSQSMSLRKNLRKGQSEISRWSFIFFSQCLRIGVTMQQQLHMAKKYICDIPEEMSTEQVQKHLVM